MFNQLSSPAALLASRRSGKARDLVAPGPDAAQLARILAAATRTPDHGKLAPWRFVIVAETQRDVLATLLATAYQETRLQAGRLELEANQQFARQAPLLIVALSVPAHDSHIPIWEQELSTGAACMNLITAAHAEGFVANWLTGWAAYSNTVRAAFAPEGRIAGFIFIGSASRELEERPRPDPAKVIMHWTPEPA
jgi:nitroreductase